MTLLGEEAVAEERMQIPGVLLGERALPDPGVGLGEPAEHPDGLAARVVLDLDGYVVLLETFQGAIHRRSRRACRLSR